MAFDWNEKSVLVTGATGLAGAWLAQALVQRGAEVVTLARSYSSASPFAQLGLEKKVSVSRGDIRSYRDAERTVNEYEVAAVFHLGGFQFPGSAISAPVEALEAEVKGAWNVLEACRNAKLVKRMVFASSDSAYAPSEKMPLTEDMPVAGEGPYEAGKSCADLLARTYFLTYGTPVAIARTGIVYGGGDLDFNRLVPGTMKATLEGKAPVVRTNGKRVREFIYARDAAEAYISLAEHIGEKKGIAGDAFNFGTGERHTVLQVAEKAAQAAGGRKKPQVLAKDAETGQMEVTLSCAKARRLIGWKAKWPLAKGLKETAEWYAHHVRARR